MIRRQNIKFVFLFLLTTSLMFRLSAQDTTKKKTIDITSTFKPVLRDAVKINFNAAPPAADSSKVKLNYQVPQQNLMFNYEPSALSPVALQIDSLNAWKNSNYIKVGVGNVHIPYIQAGFSFGDGKSTFFNIFAHQYTSKGDLPFQKNSLTGVSAYGTYKTAKDLEWSGKLGFKSDDYYLYGYKPDTLVFTKDQLRQRYQTIEGSVGLRNLTPTEFGLTYNPNLKVAVFNGENNGNKATETNSVLNLPLQKFIGKSFGINLGFTADLTNYKPATKGTIQNNLYYISPALLLRTPNLYMQAGILPSWDNGLFKLLPNVYADISTNDQLFTIQLGWIGYYEKGSFQRFASINPWIAQPDELRNTRVREIYGGFKGTMLKHFTYNAKVSFLQLYNLPLFQNDTTDGKTFVTVYTPGSDMFQVHGEIGYIQGETFNASAGLTLKKFSKIEAQEKAWGILPMEFKATMRWQIMKDLFVKGDLFAWDGAPYRTPAKETRKGDSGFDLNAGVEFRITRQLNLWVQMNNILNNKYERWNQYEVYGFNILGGIVFNFNQK